MWKGKLKRVGGSVMVAIPPEARRLLNLEPNAPVQMFVQKGTIVLQGPTVGRIGLAARLASVDLSVSIAQEECDWMDMRPVGNEALEGRARTGLIKRVRERLVKPTKHARKAKTVRSGNRGAR